MKKLIGILSVLQVLLIYEGCRKPYNPPAINSPGSYVVVEGTINTTGITNVKLSKTVSLSSTTTINPVSGASISIQSSQGASYPLTEGAPGMYQSASLSLDNNQQYRLSIATNDGQHYLSDFESVAVSPPIDSLGFNIVGNNLQPYVSTHDPTNATKYYRWDYNETWQFHAEYQSFFVSNGKAIVERTAQQQIYNCFSSDTGSNINLVSTSQLSQALVYQNVLTTVPSTSEKIETEYSLQVNQYALTGEAYNFWNNLAEDTENLGSIFDPQPSQIDGNIHNTTNPSSPVIGYISVCAVQTKRIFISNSQLPLDWLVTYPYNTCSVDTQWFSEPPKGYPEVQLNLIPLTSNQIPLTGFYIQGVLEGYLSSQNICVDCTIRGTTNVPPFWPADLAASAGTLARRPKKVKL